jgi:hypothetical protein
MCLPQAIQACKPLVEPLDRWTAAEAGEKSFSSRAAHVLKLWGRKAKPTRTSPVPAPATPPRTAAHNPRVGSRRTPAPPMPRTPSHSLPTQRPSTGCRDGVGGRHEPPTSQGTRRPPPLSPAAQPTGNCTRPTARVTGRTPHMCPTTPAVHDVRHPLPRAAGDNGDGQGPCRAVFGRCAPASRQGLATQDAVVRDVYCSQVRGAREEAGGTVERGRPAMDCTSAGECEMTNLAMSLGRQCVLNVQISSSTCCLQVGRIQLEHKP